MLKIKQQVVRIWLFCYNISGPFTEEFWRSVCLGQPSEPTFPCGATICSFPLLLLLNHFSRVWLCATGSPPGSPVPGILQARTLEWVSRISFSNAWKWSHSVVSDSSRTYGLQPTRLLRPWDFTLDKTQRDSSIKFPTDHILRTLLHCWSPASTRMIS